MKPQSYYNTVSLSGEPLKQAITKAKNQSDAILLLYKNWRKPLSPSQVLLLMQKAGKNWPLTSIRARITTLCTNGDLVKNQNGKMVESIYGESEHTWEINEVRYPVTQESEKLKEAEQANLFEGGKAA